MSAPLKHFAVTTAWLWLQLVALGAVYVVRAPAEATPPTPAEPSVDAPARPETPAQFAAGTPGAAIRPAEVVPPPVTPPTPRPNPRPRLPPGRLLPAGVDWAAGEVLLLVAGPNFTLAERGVLRNEIDRVVADRPGAVVGGTAFVCDREAAWGLATAGPTAADPFRTEQPADFAEAFAQVARVGAAVRQARGRPATVVVLWHGLRAPPLREFPAAARDDLPAKFAGTLVWSGVALESDAVPDSVLSLFDARSLSLHGRDLVGLAGTVANGLRLTPIPPREGDR